MRSRGHVPWIGWRDFREQDLAECLKLDSLRMGAELTGQERTASAWKRLRQSCAFSATVLEASPTITGHSIVGFGASVFVTRAFAEREISNPRPGLNARIIASVDSGRPVVLTEAELRRANTHSGLDQVILYASLRAGILSEDRAAEARGLMSSRYFEQNAGYRMNRLIVELTGADDPRAFTAMKMWRVINRFEEFHAMHPDSSWDKRRALAIPTRKEALSVAGSVISFLFQHREPVLWLRDIDQRLLSAALGGLTDEELSSELRIPLPKIKKRWLWLFGRASSARPDLFPAEEPGRQIRGRQKRHRLLAYVRSHPEELRPIESCDPTGRLA